MTSEDGYMYQLIREATSGPHTILHALSPPIPRMEDNNRRRANSLLVKVEIRSQKIQFKHTL